MLEAIRNAFNLPDLHRISRSGSQIQSLLITCTGVLIVVGVVLDTVRQLEAQLLMRRYEGFLQ